MFCYLFLRPAYTHTTPNHARPCLLVCLVLPACSAVRESRDDRHDSNRPHPRPRPISHHIRTLTYYPSLPGFDSSCVDFVFDIAPYLRLRLRLDSPSL